MMGQSSLADCGFYAADLQTLNEQLFIVLYIVTEKLRKLYTPLNREPNDHEIW